VTLRHRPFFRVNLFLVITSNGSHVTFNGSTLFFHTTHSSPPHLSLPTTTTTPTSMAMAMETQDACPESPCIFSFLFFFFFLLTTPLCSTGDMVTAWLVLAPTNDTGPGGDPPGHNGVFFFLPFFQTNCFFFLFRPIFYIGTTTTMQHHPAQAHNSKTVTTKQERQNRTNRTHRTATNRTMTTATTMMTRRAGQQKTTTTRDQWDDTEGRRRGRQQQQQGGAAAPLVFFFIHFFFFFFFCFTKIYSIEIYYDINKDDNDKDRQRQ
jgi:hypothetical protein